MTRMTRLVFIGAVVGTLAVFVPSALARKKPPPPNAAIAVYVEQIPTGGGSVAANAQAGGSKLPPAIEQKVRRNGGADAGALERLATAPGLGAPARARRPEPRSAIGQSTPQAQTTPTDSLGAPQEDRGLVGLIVVLVLVTAAVVAARLLGGMPEQNRGKANAHSGSHAPS
jgi:hypothetical protein